MEQLRLIHLPPHQDPGFLARFPLWKTCLRQIVFLPSDMMEFHTEQHPILDGAEALQFLIEVLCGLHSPLVGENEVLGQFKQFLLNQGDSAFFDSQQKWIQFVLQEVKKIRAQHIHRLGSKSYGSLLRKLTQEQMEVSIFGTGQFAEEILPWLSHKKKIQMIGRNSQRLQFFEGKYPQLSIVTLHQKNKVALAPHVLIAATVSNESVLEYFNKNDLSQVKCIYDLRGLASEQEELELLQMLKQAGLRCEVIFLRHLFQSMESQRQQNLQLIGHIKIELNQNISAFLNRLEHRPLGWDDLCA